AQVDYQCQQYANSAADYTQYQRFGQKLAEDLAVSGTHGFTDADFSRPFRNRHQHDIHDANASHQQRYGSYSGNKPGQRIEDIASHGQVFVLAQYRKVVLLAMGSQQVTVNGR